MKRCNIPPSSCRHKYAAPCCRACDELDCPNRCQNDPERCKCWSDKPPRQRRERKVSSTQVVWLYSEGMTQQQIAEQLGCDRKTVAAVLHELGVGRHVES